MQNNNNNNSHYYKKYKLMERNKKQTVKNVYININIRLLKCAAEGIHFTVVKNQFNVKQIQFSAENHSIWHRKN